MVPVSDPMTAPTQSQLMASSSFGRDWPKSTAATWLI
jgi:hypothetical protein